MPYVSTCFLSLQPGAGCACAGLISLARRGSSCGTTADQGLCLVLSSQFSAWLFLS